MNEFDQFFSNLCGGHHQYDKNDKFDYNRIKNTDFITESEEIKSCKKNIDSFLNKVFLTGENSCYLKLSVPAMLDVVNVLFDKRLNFLLETTEDEVYKKVPSYKELLLKFFNEQTEVTLANNTAEYIDISSHIVSTFLLANIPCSLMFSGFVEQHRISIEDILKRKTKYGKIFYDELQEAGYDMQRMIDDFFNDPDFVRNNIGQHLDTKMCSLANKFLLQFDENDLSNNVKVRVISKSGAMNVIPHKNLCVVSINFRTKSGYTNFIRGKKNSLYSLFKRNTQYAEDLITFVTTGEHDRTISFCKEHPNF